MNYSDIKYYDIVFGEEALLYCTFVMLKIFRIVFYVSHIPTSENLKNLYFEEKNTTQIDTDINE